MVAHPSDWQQRYGRFNQAQLALLGPRGHAPHGDVPAK